LEKCINKLHPNNLGRNRFGWRKKINTLMKVKWSARKKEKQED
jgi:hypothetical protein